MTWDWMFLLLCIILLLYVSDIEGSIKMAISDLQKLVENMKRAQSITDRAATDATKHSAIMDSFEQRLQLNHENMSKIEEYDKLMSQMEQISNGGPALETTFSSDATATSTSNSTGEKANPLFLPNGRQI